MVEEGPIDIKENDFCFWHVLNYAKILDLSNTNRAISINFDMVSGLDRFKELIP